MGTAEQVTHDYARHPFVEIMDSTLRDGEQTSGVSFLPHEKMRGGIGTCFSWREGCCQNDMQLRTECRQTE